jgi:signal transduction histidine kinase
MIFEKLKNVSKNLGETMNDLMDTMKVKANTNIEKVDIRFKEVLDKVVQTLEGDLILAEASVTYNFKAASIVYPKAYVESIFQNLLTNALKYRAVDRKPIIHFESIAVENTIELKVSDNGMGIDMERFGDKLFGLHKTFHTNQEARGVGLFLIKTQIETLGGSITAESKVDEGTTFIIRF